MWVTISIALSITGVFGEYFTYKKETISEYLSRRINKPKYTKLAKFILYLLWAPAVLFGYIVQIINYVGNKLFIVPDKK